MNKKGFVRLSVALSAALLAGGIYRGTFGEAGAIRELEDFRAYMCVNAPDASPQELKKCAAELSVNEPAPKLEHLTRETYWAEALGVAFLMDVALAAFFLGVAWISRWVGRGFNVETDPLEPAEPTRVSGESICLDSATARKSRAIFFPRDPEVPARTPAVSSLVVSGSQAPQQ